jgi:hypothetical protein
MSTLREHAEARRKRTQLSEVDAETFRQALARTYEAIAPDVWGDCTPEDDEYAVVVIDRLPAYGRLTDEELKRFGLLTLEIKRALALAVGP